MRPGDHTVPRASTAANPALSILEGSGLTPLTVARDGIKAQTPFFLTIFVCYFLLEIKISDQDNNNNNLLKRDLCRS